MNIYIYNSELKSKFPHAKSMLHSALTLSESKAKRFPNQTPSTLLMFLGFYSWTHHHHVFFLFFLVISFLFMGLGSDGPPASYIIIFSMYVHNLDRGGPRGTELTPDTLEIDRLFVFSLLPIFLFKQDNSLLRHNLNRQVYPSVIPPIISLFLVYYILLYNFI